MNLSYFTPYLHGQFDAVRCTRAAEITRLACNVVDHRAAFPLIEKISKASEIIITSRESILKNIY